jgi:hypothetical protein
VIGPGERVPQATVWIDPDDDGEGGLALDALAADGPFLLLFYLYDWTST